MELRAVLRRPIDATIEDESTSLQPLKLCYKLVSFFVGNLRKHRGPILLIAFTIISFIFFAYFDILQVSPIRGLLLSFNGKVKSVHVFVSEGAASTPSSYRCQQSTQGLGRAAVPISSITSSTASGEQEEDKENVEIIEMRKQIGCNVFKGRWVVDASFPMYDVRGCPFADEGFRCEENGRPHLGFLKWRWQPYQCDIPRFDAGQMLEMLRDSRLIFVGDSIGRNQWESMLCLLAQAVPNKTHIFEVNGQPITKHKGFLIFRFQDYNCTVEYYRSPFLVPQGHPPPNSPPQVRTTLKVDTIDWISQRWIGARIIVFNAGHWWSSDKTQKSGCFFQIGNHLNLSMSVQEGFARSMQTWREWVLREIDFSRTQIFFQTYASVHFRGGTWKGGGHCHDESEPFPPHLHFKTEPWTNAILHQEIIGNVPKVQLLNVTNLSAYRKDGHPSLYNNHNVSYAELKEDCSHWCLPGVPDTWNHLLFVTLLNRLTR